MSDHAAVKDEHRKESEMFLRRLALFRSDCGMVIAAPLAQLLADFARKERLKEAEWWVRFVGPQEMMTFADDGVTPKERVEQLKRGEL